MTMISLLLTGLALLPVAGLATVTTEPWGKTAGGQAVEVYKLSNAELTVRITNYGAHVVSIEAPDKNGVKADVVLGYSDLAGYEADAADARTYMGAVVGRYGNRIGKGTFSLDGVTYHLPQNNGVNTLHGGDAGFDTRVWTGRVEGNSVLLTLHSPDGDMGFPGNLTATVRYTLEGKSLRMDYTATTDKATVINMTNHSYFNLGGEGSGSITGEIVKLNAEKYTPVDSGLIPTGELAPVAGTPFDFTKPHWIHLRIGADNDQLKSALGYDHNFVLGPADSSGMRLAAQVSDPKTGRTLTVTTTEPGVQFYTGNHLEGKTKGPSGAAYDKRAGFCLETQHFPDSPNQPSFPSTVLRPGQTMHSTTVFTFGVEHVHSMPVDKPGPHP